MTTNNVETTTPEINIDIEKIVTEAIKPHVEKIAEDVVNAATEENKEEGKETQENSETVETEESSETEENSETVKAEETVETVEIPACLRKFMILMETQFGDGEPSEEDMAEKYQELLETMNVETTTLKQAMPFLKAKLQKDLDENQAVKDAVFVIMDKTAAKVYEMIAEPIVVDKEKKDAEQDVKKDAEQDEEEKEEDVKKEAEKDCTDTHNHWLYLASI